MNFNSFPTDNLYKFLALTGLFLVVFNVFFTGDAVYEINERYLDHIDVIENESSLLKEATIESQAFVEALEEYEKAYRKAFIQLNTLDVAVKKAELNPNKTTVRYALLLRDSLTDVKNSLDSTSESLGLVRLKLQRKRARIDSLSMLSARNKRRLENIEAKHNYFRNLLFFGSLMGAIMMVYGFYKWIELQTRLDQILFRRPIDNSHFKRPKKLSAFITKKKTY